MGSDGEAGIARSAPLRADVRLDYGLPSDPPEVVAEVGQESRGFDDLGIAIAWARERAQRVIVDVDEYRFSAGAEAVPGMPAHPNAPEVQAAADRVKHARQRFDAEHRQRYATPRRWYWALVAPDVEGDVEAAAQEVARQAEVVSFRTAKTHAGEPVWMLNVLARSIEEAELAGHDAAMRVLWPPERLERLNVPGSTWGISAGGSHDAGLAEYEGDSWLLK